MTPFNSLVIILTIITSLFSCASNIISSDTKTWESKTLIVDTLEIEFLAPSKGRDENMIDPVLPTQEEDWTRLYFADYEYRHVSSARIGKTELKMDMIFIEQEYRNKGWESGFLKPYEDCKKCNFIKSLKNFPNGEWLRTDIIHEEYGSYINYKQMISSEYVLSIGGNFENTKIFEDIVKSVRINKWPLLAESRHKLNR